MEIHVRTIAGNPLGLLSYVALFEVLSLPLRSPRGTGEIWGNLT